MLTRLGLWLFGVCLVLVIVFPFLNNSYWKQICLSLFLFALALAGLSVLPGQIKEGTISIPFLNEVRQGIPRASREEQPILFWCSVAIHVFCIVGFILLGLWNLSKTFST